METIYKQDVFGLEHDEKIRIVYPRYRELTEHHYKNCREYKKIVDCIGELEGEGLEKIPFLPVRLFKEYELLSIPREKVARTVTSSGTMGQISSKIFLDKQTAVWQQKVLARIVSDFIGKTRMPMLILDSPSVVKDRTKFSTRGAGILGFSSFGINHTYVLNDDMSINYDVLDAFMKNNSQQRIFLFGFTYIIWKHFLLEIEKKQEKYDFSNAVMVHGGGWKKLINEAVSKNEFKKRFYQACGIREIYENYGMAEQTGSIFMECECGHLHVSNFSEVIIRNPYTLRACKQGEKGIMQVLSVLPFSYPGHSLLTEDEGVILGEDDCLCGRKGKYFKILGRLANAELRGCSDTYATGTK